MEHQARLRNSILILIAGTLISGCKQNQSENFVATTDVLLNRSETVTTLQNGLLIVNEQPFTGRLFTLFEASTDTAEFISYLNGREHGEWRKFYPSGKLKEKRFFNQGQKTGEYITWWENGNKQLHYFFKADEYEGTCKEWNVEGWLVKVMNYEEGHEAGPQQWWYDNGKVKANYVIENGRRYGLLGTKNCINVSDSVFRR